jgi:drug/metabolite transporter (DMT)-like permease
MTVEHRRGLLLVAAGALVWSVGGLVFRLIDVDILTVISGRSGLAGLFLLILLAFRTRGRPWSAFACLGWPGILVAFLFVFDSASYIAALHYTSIAHVVVILSLTPLFAALLGWFAMGEAVRPSVWIAMLIAFGGVCVMVSGSLQSGAWIGDLLALAVPVLMAVITVTTRRHPEVDLLSAVCLAAILSGLLFLPFARFGDPMPQDWALMALLGAIEFGGGLILYLAGAKRIPSAEAALMSLLETVLAPFWAWLVVAENPGERAILGGSIVLAAVAGQLLADLRPADKQLAVSLPPPPSAGRL